MEGEGIQVLSVRLRVYRLHFFVQEASLWQSTSIALHDFIRSAREYSYPDFRCGLAIDYDRVVIAFLLFLCLESCHCKPFIFRPSEHHNDRGNTRVGKLNVGIDD